MNSRERVNAILHYENYDRMPVVCFGFWPETLQKWASEGHITSEQAENWTDGNTADIEITTKLGFDFNWYSVFTPFSNLWPEFERKVIQELPDGTKHVCQRDGVIVVEKSGVTSIPAEIDHTLKDRASWEKDYKPRMQFTADRIKKALVNNGKDMIPFEEVGAKFLIEDKRDFHYGLMCGSLFGKIRNWLGVENSIYLYMDDPDLFKEIVDTVATQCYDCTKYVLETGAKFDFAHFWEDICFKSGPLIDPKTFDDYVGPYYKKITELLLQYGIDIVSVDCDGLIDSLIPTWINNGVNTMFPIEVGTWDAHIAPWREKYGKILRGVGGMKKYTFALDNKAVDEEIERLKPLIDLGGYIPCPDHRIAPDAKWDNVRYYCDKMHQLCG